MRLSGPISSQLISQLRGVVDVYYWKSIPCARAWPRKPKQPNSPRQLAARQRFREFYAWLRDAPPSYVRIWRAIPSDPTKTANDHLRTQGLRMAYAGRLTTPPDIVSLSISPDPAAHRSVVSVCCANGSSLDPAALHWRYLPYDQDPPVLQYYLARRRVNRQNVPVDVHEPIISHYQNPLSQTFDPSSQTFFVTLHDATPNASLILTPPGDGGAKFLFLPPIATSEALP